jgi:hypothetical protein
LPDISFMNLVSAANLSTPSDDARARSRKNLFGLLAVVLIGIGFSVIPLLNTFSKPEANKDYSRWWNAAMDVRHGVPLLLDSGEQSYIYPPGGAVVFYTPLSYLGLRGMVITLCIMNCAAHACVVLISVYYATGKSLNQHPLLYIIPAGATLPYVWDTYYLGQPNLILLALMLLGFRLLDRHRVVAEAWAGALFGAATVAKAFPATVVGFLVWRRYWAATAALVLSVVMLALILPGPVRGFAANAKESWVWVDRMILSTSGDKLANQPGRAFRAGNQSMMSVVHRLTRDIDAQPEGVETLRVNVLSLSSRAAFVIFICAALAICLAYIASMPRRGSRTRRSDGIEYAILLILITIFSPKAGTYYSCWILPGLTLATAEMLRAPAGSKRRCLLLGGLVLTLLITGSAILQVWDIFTPQAIGVTFWGTFILLLMLLGCLHMTKRRSVAGLSDDDDLGDLAPYLASPATSALPPVAST